MLGHGKVRGKDTGLYATSYPVPKKLSFDIQGVRSSCKGSKCTNSDALVFGGGRGVSGLLPRA